MQIPSILADRVSDLRKRFLWTLLFIALYRLGVFIPAPGVNSRALQEYFSDTGGGMLGLFNAFSGGALENFSIMALGVMPYITSSIIFSLLVTVFPYLEQLQKEGGDAGRRKINQFSRYAAIPISIIQGYGIAVYFLESNPGGFEVVETPGWMFRIQAIITLTCGTCLLMWIGERISERGIGNGISLIIACGIVVNFPSTVISLWNRYRMGEIPFPNLLFLALFMLAVIGAIIFFERAQRRIPIHHAKRMVGRKLAAPERQFLPLKLNMAGVIPPIFASSILMFPTQISAVLGSRVPFLQNFDQWFHFGSWSYNVVYVAGMIFFAYFYTSIQFNPNDVADNLKKSGGFIPGVRPGKPTAEYVDFILTRLTAVGAVYISVICVMPVFMFEQTHVFFGGTGLLIVVGVVIDTIAQIQAHLLSRQYEGLLSGSGGSRSTRRFRGRFG